MTSSDTHGPIWHGATVLVVENEPAQRQLVTDPVHLSP